ncbi:MAG: hypothetical protein ACRDIX_07305 [Actinomycetota bacterium]
MALCDEADDDGCGVFIGQGRLGRKIGATERTARTHLTRLRELGYIARLEDRHPKYGTDQYEISVAQLPPPESVAGRATEDISGSPPEDVSGPEGVRTPDRKIRVVSTGKGFPPTREITREPTREIRASITVDFDRFWTAYPRKVGKRAARAAFERALRRAPAEEIVAGAERYGDDPNREQEFTAHPTTWLNRDSWDDEPLPARRAAEDQGLRILQHAERLREVEHGPERGAGAGGQAGLGLPG